MFMAFLLNKTMIILVSIIVIILLCWALINSRGQVKRLEEDLGLFEESESLKMSAYKKYQEKIDELKSKVKLYKEKANAAENNPESLLWLDTDIPADIDNSIPR